MGLPFPCGAHLDKLAGEQRVMKYVADKGRFGAFAYYCWAVGILTLVLQAVK